jgi:uncharacterized membrane protein YjjP (DUF1212 family)
MQSFEPGKFPTLLYKPPAVFFSVFFWYTVRMSEILCDDLEDIAVKAGALILENGGETYRAEETVVRTARSLGAADASAFITPTVVILSYIDEYGHHHTNMRRIYRRGTNLKKVALVNDLSRRMEMHRRMLNPKRVKNILSRIENTEGYSTTVVILAAAVSSFFFTLLFGGTLVDGLCAFLIGLVLRIVLLNLDRLTHNSFIVSLISGSIISVTTDLIGLTGFKVDTSVVMIGTLMQVVPGLALVNSIRDIIAGDLMSGTARLVDAVMIAAGLSVGAASGVFAARFL